MLIHFEYRSFAVNQLKYVQKKGMVELGQGQGRVNANYIDQSTINFHVLITL